MKKRASASPSSQKLTKKTKISQQLGPNLDGDHSFSLDDMTFSPSIGREEDYYLEGDYTEDYLHQNRTCAEEALKFYNKKYHADYELVEAMASSAFLDGGIWLHCNFKAKPKTTPPGDGDSFTKLFFAELFQRSVAPFPLVAICCRILKGKTTCCQLCGVVTIKHPIRGFRAGRKIRHTYALRSGSFGN